MHLQVPYASAGRSKCDVCYGSAGAFEWAIEVKMLRLMGDNGKPNDNILMHILSPYAAHRSALTDTEKLIASGLGQRQAIAIYSYEYDDWPAAPALDAFALLASQKVTLVPAQPRDVTGLIHPVHARASVHAWEIRRR